MALTIQEDGEDFWDLSLPVVPDGANTLRPDVMLVQFLMKAYFSSPTLELRTTIEWNGILNRATGRGARFDNGVYGPLTREATLLYENKTRRPYKDGVFRPEGAWLLGHSDMYVTKVAHLNWMYRVLTKHFGWSQREGARKLNMNPLLFQELYPA